MKPPIRETSTLITMPRGAAREAFFVSSETCAEASYPVNVYWAISRPIKNTYARLVQPVSLWNPVKVKDTDWCRSGRIHSTATMINTPATCHQADTLERKPTSFTPKVFSSACAMMMITKVTKILAGVTSSTQPMRLAKAIQVEAQPKSMAAVTATSPMKLNQPTNHAHWRLLRLASRPAQKYRPPAVGEREQTSAMARATASTISPTSSQPRVSADGP